jgi:aspartate carbamoyltransferase regulatory subunit
MPGFGEVMMAEDRPYKLYKITNGIVIDHIPRFRALEVIRVLGVDKDHDSIVSIGTNFSSGKMGSKDVVKIENKELTKEELNKIAIIAPTATISWIENTLIAKKHIVELPNVLKGIVKCANPNCITRHEDIKTVFYPIKEDDSLKLRCHYCERTFDRDDIEIK